MKALEKRPFMLADKPPVRPAKPVSFWTAVDLILGAIAAAALIFMILEGI